MSQFNIINMSACILSSGQLSLLSKGLNSVPDNKIDLFQTCKDVNKFIRDITIKKHFFGVEQDKKETDTETGTCKFQNLNQKSFE